MVERGCRGAARAREDVRALGRRRRGGRSCSLKTPRVGEWRRCGSNAPVARSVDEGLLGGDFRAAVWLRAQGIFLSRRSCLKSLRFFA